MKFTFKTDKPTGRYRSFNNPTHCIKLQKSIVGSIDHKYPHRIRLMVEKDGRVPDDKNPNCSWIWITLKKESSSLEEAKAWINDNIESITQKYTLHKGD